MTLTTNTEVEKFGLNDVQHRKEFFRAKAGRLQDDANKLLKQAQDFEDKALLLDRLNTKAMRETIRLTQQGKRRLDGKTGTALATRGLTKVCGLTVKETKLHCVNEDIRLMEVYWADAWVVDMIEGLKGAGFSAQERKEFYDSIHHWDDAESIEAEAGIHILGRTP